MSDNYIDIVFDGPPSHEAGRFVEVENEQGQSINAGEWIAPGEDSDFPLWRLRINTERGMSSMAERIHNISTSKGFKEPDLDNLPEKLMLSVSELAEAMEEHRSGKPLVYFEFTRDQRHFDVEMPEVEMSSEGSWYYEEVEIDVTDQVTPLIGKLQIPPQYYKRDNRWYTMDSVKKPFDPMEWARKGAMDAKPEGILVEIADSIIRNLHMMHSLIQKYADDDPEGRSTGLSVFDIVNMKVDYNEGRPLMHGRNY